MIHRTTCFTGSRRMLCSFALATFATVLLLACRPPDWTNNRRQPLAGVKQVLLFYQKTPCFGPCPAYDARIYTDGSVELKAFGHVPFTDTLSAALTDRELAKLKRDLRHLPYQSWKTLYRSQRTDQPSTIYTFYQGGTEVKHIRHQEGGPEALLRFEKKMDALLLGVMGRSLHQ